MRRAQTCRAAFMTIVTLSLLAAACSRDRSLECTGDTRYLSGRTVPPLIVPEGLTVPDETEALRIPEPLPVAQAPEEGARPCLEIPPDFFQDQTPG